MNFTTRQQLQTLGNYEIYDDKQRAVFDKINADKDKKKWYLFYGTVGTGKNHLAIGLLKYKQTQKQTRGGLLYDIECDFVSAYSMMKEIKTNYLNSQAIEKYYSSLDFLVVSEIEKMWMTSKESERVVFHEIMDNRYEWKRQTIITTNLEDEGEFESLVGKPIIDRFTETGESLHFDWESWRKRGGV